MQGVRLPGNSTVEHQGVFVGERGTVTIAVSDRVADAGDSGKVCIPWED
jgi:hypothetical protein